MKNTLLLLGLLSVVCFGQTYNKELRFKHITSDNGLPNNAIYSINQDKYGFIWIATLDGLSKFDGYKLKVYHGNPRLTDHPVNNRPVAIVNDSEHNIWIAFSSDSTVCKYNYLTDNFSRVELKNVETHLRKKLSQYGESTRIRAENDEYIWDTKSVCLSQTSKKDHSTINYKTDSKTPWSLLDEFALSVFIDKQNVLWVGTDNGGVSFADLEQPRFSFYPFQNNTEKDIKESTIRALYQDKNKIIWIGTRNNGLAKTTSNGKVIQVFRNIPGNKNSLINNSIRKIIEDKYGFLWIGTKGGLDRFDSKTNTFEHFLYDFSVDERHNWIFSVYEDREGNLWAGTWYGLALFDRKQQKFINYFNRGNNALTQIRNITEDAKGQMWIATQGSGLSRVVKKRVNGKLQLEVKQYENVPLSSNSLKDDWLYCLSFDNYGYLWIGSGSGLNRFDPRTEKFLEFNNHKFLNDRIIHGIVCDKGSVWISHQNGLTQIDCKSLSTRDYTKKYDLYENEFSEDAFFKNEQTGELFFGGNKGYISFYPAQISHRSTPPQIIISGLRISDENVNVNQIIDERKILDKPLYLTKKIALAWRQRNFQIEFAALYFPAPENVRYAYRLTGLDNNWVYTNASMRTAVFTNLQPGTYHFEVKAANPDGIWSQKPTSMEIVILPPWWQTWWAKLIYISVAIILIVITIRFMLERQKFRHEIHLERVKAEQIKEMDDLKNKLFTNISHEFRTPLTLIIDPIEKLQQKQDIDEQSRRYYSLISKNAHRLMELVNQFLELKKIESGKMELHPVCHDFIQYIKSLTEYFSIHAQLHNIEFQFRCEEKQLFTCFDAEKMDKIILNLLTNAFKNTADGGKIELQINTHTTSRQIEIRIKDTGSGIPADQLDKIFEPFYHTNSPTGFHSSGIGLTMVKELVRLHNGKILVESQVGKGTTFTVEIPVVEGKFSAVKAPTIVMPAYSDCRELAETIPGKQDQYLPLVLIVEDNSEVRTYIANELSDAFKIIQSEDATAGFEAACQQIPDLIISDIMMPGKTGFEFCKEIKENEKTSHIPVILLTAQHANEYRIEGYECGADAFLTKPIYSAILKIRIANLIESRKKLRSMFDKSTGFDTNLIASNSTDKQFINKLIEIIYENLDSTTFDVEELASKVHLSRTQLYRKVKSMTDKTAQEFITTIKLKRAAELILTGQYSITQVSEMVGSSEVGNFSRSFFKQFGVSPTTYKNMHITK